MSLVATLARQGWLRLLDHEFALTLQRLRPETHELVLAAAALANRALAFGHSALRLDRLALLFTEIAPGRDAPELPAPAAWHAALRESAWVEDCATRDSFDARSPTPLVLDGGHIYLRRYHGYETRLAQALLARTQSSRMRPAEASTDARLRQLFPSLAQDPADAQARAAQAFRDSPLLLLTGGPGTGKTTTVARALVLRIEDAVRAGRAPLRIALAAPTGKAAARLAQAVRDSAQALRAQGLLAEEVMAALPSEASTLHRLLGWRSGAVQFRHDALHPLPADIVVVDEASMVDLPLMCKLVEAVAPGAALLLIGDRDQLPSVETGAALAALCDAADAGGALAAHRVALTRGWRQHDDLDVASLAAHVRDGEPDAALQALREGRLRGIDWIPARERSPWPALESRALAAYRAVAAADSPLQALERAQRLRVLTAVREGPAGSVTLNAQIAQALQAPDARGERFFHGALLIVTENSYRHGLFNGDIGLVWRDAADGDLRVWFERGDGSEDGLCAWLPSALPAHEPAFALTVHKSQGSEFDDVLLVLPPGGGEASRVLSRELLYTGLTRCRRSLALWADEAALRAAIARPALRWSGLAGRLR